MAGLISLSAQGGLIAQRFKTDLRFNAHDGRNNSEAKIGLDVSLMSALGGYSGIL